jgi:hypothetical protein
VTAKLRREPQIEVEAEHGRYRKYKVFIDGEIVMGGWLHESWSLPARSQDSQRSIPLTPPDEGVLRASADLSLFLFTPHNHVGGAT